MKKIYLHITSYDIFHSDYLESNNCAISRALERAGYSNLRHEGTDISNIETGETLIGSRNPSFRELTQIVWEMYEAKAEGNFKAVNGFHYVLKY